ncbi:protein MGARP-like [Myxocyprinus asiaticus]|uniref:protein MGARP-like n=1 Tax=Myxocyprinus asiaticus TaxID=70543 RepID=UPI002222E416|nr:protein MGARP-like [Myxocyprinus asiaticus]
MMFCRAAWQRLAPLARKTLYPLSRNVVPTRQMSFGIPASGTNIAYMVLGGGSLTAALVYAYKTINSDSARYNDRIAQIEARPKKVVVAVAEAAPVAEAASDLETKVELSTTTEATTTEPIAEVVAAEPTPAAAEAPAFEAVVAVEEAPAELLVAAAVEVEEAIVEAVAPAVEETAAPVVEDVATEAPAGETTGETCSVEEAA